MLKKMILLTVGTFFLWGTVSCGTLIYPERRGQRSGRIDPGVAILDGVGLLVFIIPGLIAYAIDFSTGAIYMPSRRRSEGETGVKIVLAKSREWKDIAAAIEQSTGRQPDLADPDLRIYQPDGRDQDLGAELAALAAGQPAAAAWKACSISPDGALTTADGWRVATF
ncbi:MAG: hypothetical protein P8Y63_08370 [Deltaproteobacteria bacterium]|jgi:hypothetical protein